MKKHCSGIFLALMLLILGALPSKGQAVADSISSDRYVLYYICDDIEIDENYLDNAYQIFRIKDILARSPQIDSITVYAYASPEGPFLRNKWLAEKRALAAREFILKNLPKNSVLKPENIHLRPMGENWEGLESELEANYHLANRNAVMNIIHAHIPTENKKWRLKNLDNGYTFNYIIRNHMPKLRLATWVCMYISPDRPVRVEFKEPELEFPKRIDAALPVQTPEYREQKTILALKSNLLYDLFTLVNYSIEVPFAKNLSALYYHQFPWWRWGEADNQYCIRFLSIGAEGRWWFKPKPRPQMGKSVQRDKLMGHFVGLYAESGKWDFGWGRDICHQGEHWSVGLSYGYSMPLGRRLNMEFSLSLGYASIAYRGYTPSEDYEILWRDPAKQGRWHYFGPTKAQVSLVVPITMKTKRKGGAR
jgi:hypothetical protein